jgi:hypothetical protein
VPAPDPAARNSRWPFALLFLLVLAVGGAGYLLWAKYNPYFDRAPQFQEARALQAAVRHRPLTPKEFADCLRLCESDDAAVRASAVATAEAAAGRTPEYRPSAAEVLTRLADGGDPSAGAALKRLTDPPRE